MIVACPGPRKTIKCRKDRSASPVIIQYTEQLTARSVYNKQKIKFRIGM